MRDLARSKTLGVLVVSGKLELLDEVFGQALVDIVGKVVVLLLSVQKYDTCIFIQELYQCDVSVVFLLAEEEAYLDIGVVADDRNVDLIS